MAEFDLRDPLPTGTTVLQASAGTGKTYAIEGLVVRYVAAGYPLRNILVVTFTRAAAAELRDRVRRRLLRVAEHLDGVLGGAPAGSADAVAELLARQPPAEVRRQRQRLTDALADFDAATISTIHGFCQQALAGLGLSGDLDPSATLLEDLSELVDDVVDDVVVRLFAGRDGGPPFARRPAQSLARVVVANPESELVPSAPESDEGRDRRHFVDTVVAEVDRRKRAAGLLSYDDWLTRLVAALRDARVGPAVAGRLRQQYEIALVDEFQDTDPVQWEILRRLFGASVDGPRPAALVLVGDPKQAIYAFRGADVHAYLDAVGSATLRSLPVSYRADQPLLDAFNALFLGATLGHAAIPYEAVRADPERHGRGIDAAAGAPLRLRVVRRDAGVRKNTGKTPTLVAASARRFCAADAAAQIVALLQSGAHVEGRPVRPGDVAVLARTNAEAALVQKVLGQCGVPAVINGVGSVFATAAATDWLRLLEALEQPGSAARARAAALTSFVGWSGAEVAEHDDEARWSGLAERLRRWSAVLRDGSVASLLQTVVLEQRLPERLLAREGGERLLTDVEHIGELLHAAAAAEDLGPAALSTWLRERIADAEEDTVEVEQRARRLESDADAVQVLTIHRSKGLEFPIVFCPFLWSKGREDDVPVFHEDGRRRIDVGGEREQEHNQRKAQALREQRDEQLRLLYVALTRARHQVVVWWAPAGGSDVSALARLLFCRGASGSVNLRCNAASLPDDDLTLDRLAVIEGLAPGAIEVEEAPDWPRAVRWEPGDAAEADLAAAVFDRSIDVAWRRSSYSSLTAAAHAEATVASEPEDGVLDDEDLAPAAVVQAGAGPDEARLRAVPSAFAQIPAGVDVGTFVHAVLEHADFAATDLRAELAGAVAEQGLRHRVDVDADGLVEALVRAVETPLGPLAGGLRLRDFGRADRSDELAFELPLAGGPSPRGRVDAASVGRLLREHLPAGDPVAAYARRLAEPSFHVPLRGYLTGSIDAVLRLPGTSRFAVVDYKTNWLGPFDEPLTAWHYRPPVLAGAMERGHYPLQALLYTVALHRYLRWRVRGYDPAAHLAGVLYLFLRGMTGADVPSVDGRPCGVFSWQPPPALVVALSDLLDAGARAA